MGQLSNKACNSNRIGKNIYELLNTSTSFQGVRRLFVLANIVAGGVANDGAGIKKQ